MSLYNLICFDVIKFLPRLLVIPIVRAEVSTSWLMCSRIIDLLCSAVIPTPVYSGSKFSFLPLTVATHSSLHVLIAAVEAFACNRRN